GAAWRRSTRCVGIRRPPCRRRSSGARSSAAWRSRTSGSTTSRRVWSSAVTYGRRCSTAGDASSSRAWRRAGPGPRDGDPGGVLDHVLARLAGAGGFDRSLHVPFFLGRREHGRHAERLDPQLAAPAGRMVEMLIFLVLDLIVGGHER